MVFTTVSPPRQAINIELDNSIDDQWRMVNDQNWPSQLVSSIEYGEHPLLVDELRPDIDKDVDADPHGHRDRDQRSRMDEATHDKEDLATTHHQSSQPVPIKMLTRPISSHEDLAAGFAFGKAGPAPKFDFCLKQQQNPSIHFNSNPPPMGEVATETSPPDLPAVVSEVAATEHKMANAPGNPGFSPNHANTSMAVLALPFPNVEHIQAYELGLTTKPTSAAHISPDIPSPRTMTNDVTMSGDDTLIGQQMPEMNTACHHQIADQIHDKAHQEPTLFEHVVQEAADSHQPSQNSHRKHMAKPSRAAQTTPITSTKVTKSRRKRPMTGPTSKGNPRATIPPVSYKEEDLLTYFTLKYKQGLHDRHLLEEAYNAKDAELRDLREVSSGLFTQIEDMEHQVLDMEQRHNETEKRLLKMAAAKPRWDAKVKKLSDFIKGLSNDHNRLRDNSKDLRDRQLSVLKDKEILTEGLREVHRNAEDQRVKSNQLVTEARHDLRMLGQTVQHQQSELNSKQALLLAERKRSSRLEEQISSFANGHGHLTQILSGHRDIITSKINELLSKAESFQATIPPESQEVLRPMMEQCVTLLLNLPDSDTIKPDDLDVLKSCMRDYFESITRSIEACEHSTTMTEAGHQHLTISMNTQLQALGDNIIAEHTLSEQVMDLREIKAILRERVSESDKALKDARLQIVALQHKDQEQSRKINQLEGSLAKAPPLVDESLTLFRLHELDARNKDLERDLAGSRVEATSLAHQAGKTSNEYERLQARMADTQLQLEEALRETEVVREEKISHEHQATQQLEQLREDMTKRANQELVNLRKEKPKNSFADEKLAHVTKQFIITKASKEKADQEVTQMKESLDSLGKERQRETAFAERLYRQVQAQQGQLQAQEVALTEVKGNLDAANADNSSKDGYIKILQASQAKRQAEQEAEKPRNQQQTSPSNRSQHFGHPSIVVEDSQPASNAVVVPAELLSDPFMGNEYPGSQQPSVSEADLQSLFPGTPVAQKSLDSDPRLSKSRANMPSPQIYDPRKEQHKLFSRQKISETHSKDTSHSKRQVNGSASKPQRPQVNVPRGILKDPRGEKRPAATGGLIAPGMAAPKRRKSSLAELGPVIADSQSPDRLLLGKGRKQSIKGRKTAKGETEVPTIWTSLKGMFFLDEEMSRRFSQELH